MKYIYLIVPTVLCMLFGSKLKSQSYNFTQSTAVYSDLANSTDLTMGMPWDDPALLIPVNFPFFYFGNSVDNIYIDYGLGGVMVMGVDTINITASLFVADNADLIDRGYLSTSSLSPISYETTGTANNRILKIEWKNVGFYSELMLDSVSSDFVNFQIWLYESDNSIELHYGPNSISQPWLSYDGYTGTSIALVSQLNYFSGSPSNSWLNLHGDANNPSYSVRLATDTPLFFSNIIPNGTVYRFTPFTVGLDESQKVSTEAFISPNPVSNRLSVSNIDEMEISSMKIYDLKGQEVKSTISTSINDIDVSELESGVYILQLIGNKGMKQLKFIKK